MYRILLATIFFTVLAAPVNAAESKYLQLDLGKGEFSSQRSAVEKAVVDDNNYSEISKEQIASLHGDFDTIQSLIGDKQGLDGLDEPQQKQVLDLQADINSILYKAGQDSRMICRSEPITGSIISKKVCLTAAARERGRVESQSALRTVRAARFTPEGH